MAAQAPKGDAKGADVGNLPVQAPRPEVPPKGTPTQDEVDAATDIEAAKAAAIGANDAADAIADAAKAKIELAALPMAPLGPLPSTDVVGRALDWAKPDEAHAQQRTAVLIRQARVEEDTLRTQRGLPPKWAEA